MAGGAIVGDLAIGLAAGVAYGVSERQGGAAASAGLAGFVGRAALLWNQPPRYQPEHKSLRDELSISFSSDDCKTWSKPRVIATRYPVTGDKAPERRVSYPYLYEPKPGELWITTMQGGLRMNIRTEDIESGEAPQAPAIVMFGDSTTAFRPGAIKQVYSERVYADLLKKGTSLVVSNRGIGGNTTAMARA
eukprot:gene18225-22305_t